MTDEPWLKIAALQSAVFHGGSSLESIPDLIVSVCGEPPLWREFPVPGLDEPVRHERFEDFVTATAPRGLGATVKTLKRIVADDNEATVMLRNALKGKPGPGSVRNPNRTGGTEDRSYTLDRLAREAPDLRQRVDDGELSANAAAVKAGMRPRRFTVSADPEAAARTLKKQLTPEQVAQLKELL